VSARRKQEAHGYRIRNVANHGITC
jgi:hypothetical protein